MTCPRSQIWIICQRAIPVTCSGVWYWSLSFDFFLALFSTENLYEGELLPGEQRVTPKRPPTSEPQQVVWTAKNCVTNLVWRRHLLGYYDTDRWLFISLRYFAARDKSKQQSRDLKSRLRQTADSCWEFLKIETQQIKQFKTILMDKNNEKLLTFCRR